MVRVNTKVSKIIVATMMLTAVAFSVMGCSVEKTVTNTETHIDENGNKVTTTSTQTMDKNGKIKNGTAEVAIEPAENTELITYEFDTFDNVHVVMDENSIIAQEPSDDPEYSDLVSEEARGNIIAPGRDFVYLEDDDYYYVADIYRHLITVADKSKSVAGVFDDELPENPGSFETDDWSITYDTDNWYGYVTEEGSTIINYLGECAGTSLIEISEVDVPTAKEAIAMLEEKTGTKLTVSNDLQIGESKGYFAYEANKEYNPEYIYIDDFYTIYEHNGKVIILNETITHDFDDSRAEALADIFLEQKNALVLK